MAREISTDKFQQRLADVAESLRIQIEAEVDAFPTDEQARELRVSRTRKDFWRFAKTYFPHYIKKEPSGLHRFLAKRLPEIIAAPSSQNDAIAAPRSGAKSTVVSVIFPIWCIVHELKHNIIHIMDTIDQSAENLEAVKAELEANVRLRMDYPTACGEGRTWQAAKIITNNNVKMEAFGSGKKVRGKRHGAYRPDLVIGDDLENDENVQSPEQRDKLSNWLKKAVLKLGGAGEKCDVIIVGTVLHHDSVLNRLLSNPMWRRKRFQAIIHWPDNMDLWEEFENICASGDLDDEDDVSLDAALEFYAQNKAAMDEGAVVLWPDAQPIVDLMIIRIRDGHDAFDSEYQNDPTAGANAPFSKSIHFWVNRIAHWIFYGACDPSLGKKAKGRDPSALLVGGLNRETGILDVVEASIKKRIPDLIISDVIEFQREYGCMVWGVESVQFQEFFRTEMVKRSAIANIPVPARAVIPHADKMLRIESLQPHMANELLRLHRSQKVLINQLRHFPKADHDDGPDALHMLWMLARSGAGGIPAIQSKPRPSGKMWESY